MNRNRRNLSEKNRADALLDEQADLTGGICRLTLKRGMLRQLRRHLKDCAFEPFRSNLSYIEVTVQSAAAGQAIRLPGSGGVPRILRFARDLVSEGRLRLDADAIEEKTCRFDRSDLLEMRELIALPDALRIAMCEGFCTVAETAARIEAAKAAAARWANPGKRYDRGFERDAVFIAEAARICMHGSDDELRRRMTSLVRDSGQRMEWSVERAQRIEADCVTRTENLLHLMRLLEATDWMKCFERISPVETELNSDAVYAQSDSSTKAEVRSTVGQLSRALKEPEIVVVRRALQLCAQEHAETACVYFLADAGVDRLCASFGESPRRHRRVPDPTGRASAAMLASLGAALTAAALAFFEIKWMALLTLPMAWVAAERLTARFFPRFIRPMRLPKLKLSTIPNDARTLVVLPVLLGSAERAAESVSRLAELGCLETDANLDFLLLGDLRDAKTETLPDDAEIVGAVRTGVGELNRRSEREKYFCLIRRRSFRAEDRCWMGENRKRGAIVELNRLLLGGEAVSFAECDVYRRDYRYVVTLDSDTEYLPGTIHKLVGAMLHPLNARYTVLQPDMQLTADATENLFARIVYGSGGIDAYPTAVSGFFQDMAGRGSFAGKGIYEIKRFADATDGALPDAEILSHDLIEGILAGAGNLCDVRFYDGCPQNLSADLKRAHRWTRGDWQLLRVLFSVRMAAIDRIRIAGNLLRSLYAPAMTLLILLSAWLDAPKAFLTVLFVAYLEPLLRPFRSGTAWKRATLEIALLPVRGWYALDAAARSLWRLLVSRKHLMDWVPSADACGTERLAALPGRIAAILILPALARPLWLPAAAAMAALFWIGTGWADDLVRTVPDRPEPLQKQQTAWLRGLARQTWRFFETYVPADGNGLPPDNVQIDPPAGAARRTSPTNIGLYLTACLAAKEMRFIGEEAMLDRMRTCISTLESLEKWKGHFYNWYDTDALVPLHPRYISSVDGGNLAASLLLCAHAVKNTDAALSGRMQSLAREMDFSRLYDPERDLFYIGIDAETGHVSRSHYDLYASESRVLSFTALMLNRIPLRHWQRLSRPEIRFGKQCALLSWSGTMFEYLMPELFLESPEQSLMGKTRRSVVEMQKMHGRRLERPWGVSESGYCAFDLSLNYQYRAFGLRTLALNGAAQSDVLSPYASALALAVEPAAAAENLARMSALGWRDEFGMFEAADYRDGGVRLVRSHMAHHQGMLLCAICNALNGNCLRRRFMEIPEARSLRLLLHERPGAIVRRRGKPKAQPGTRRAPLLMYTPLMPGEVMLMHGGGTTAIAASNGAVYVRRGELLLNRFSGDLTSADEGLYVHLKTDRRDHLIAEHPEFDAGCARYRALAAGISACRTAVVSPESGTLYEIVKLENRGDAPRDAEITACMPVALMNARDWQAHPVFQNLFVESARLGENAIRFRRRPREKDEAYPEMIFACSETAQFETDLEVLTGRCGAVGMAGGIADSFAETAGCTRNPCAALRVRVRLAPGETRQLHFALGVSETEDRMIDPMYAKRALQLARAQARSMVDFSFDDVGEYRLCQRVSALLIDAKLRPQIDGNARTPAPRELLWRAGISGERPILAAEIGSADEMPLVLQLVRMRGFYAMMGVETDLVLIAADGGDYRRTVVEALHAAVGSAAHIFILDASTDARALAAIQRAAALNFSGTCEWRESVRNAIEACRVEEGSAYAPMDARKIEPPKLAEFNGYGGFNENAYVILLRDGKIPPAPWSNVVSSERAGALMTERGGGFAWNRNSRSGRLTPFRNDALYEGWGWMFYLIDPNRQRWTRLLPGDLPMTEYEVRFEPDACAWRGAADDYAFEIRTRASESGVLFEIELRNDGRSTAEPELIGAVDWQMGTDAADAAMLRTWAQAGACFAAGAAGGIGCWMSDSVRARPGCSRRQLMADGDWMNPRGFENLRRNPGGWTLCVPVKLRPRETRVFRFALEGFADPAAAVDRVRAFRNGAEAGEFSSAPETLRIETSDETLNTFVNAFLPAQILNARIRGRTGLYQPGGAYGFRDQLQDMLPLIYTDPRRVRRHILDCAARQFAAGDVLHWWHPPYAGVRTGIRDDLLFLPYVTERYVEITGDAAILNEAVPFLEDVEIPAGKADRYAEMTPSDVVGTLNEHCMRALRYAAETGGHGLCMMGGGDWNDGMNRVGGESVWLTEFLAVCAERYAEIALEEDDREELRELSTRLKAALEASGWGGDRYLRAYAADGTVLGSAGQGECRIDAISQAWAVFAGLDARRCAAALDTAWRELVDEDAGIIKLLDPPFTGAETDPGYIAAYPPGIRENGGQYTHAACWLLIAWIRAGDAQRAHTVLKMLLPYRHPTEIYRAEPYVMAADVCADELHPGRGGWTWYTGSAAWMRMAVFELLGFERRGNRVRMNALLGDWETAGVTLRFGGSAYHLRARRDAAAVLLDGQAISDEYVTLIDDGHAHEAVFPARR